jgi:hypothetical protein
MSANETVEQLDTVEEELDSLPKSFLFAKATKSARDEGDVGEERRYLDVR